MFDFLKQITGKDRVTSPPANQKNLDPAPCALEAALLLHRIQKSQESMDRFLQALGLEHVFLITSLDGDLEQASTTRSRDGTLFIAIFSSAHRAEEVIAAAALNTRPLAVSALEIIYRIAPGTGLVLNPTHPTWEWTFLPEEIESMRQMYAEALQLTPGSLHVLRENRAYHVAKILATDDHGVHIRIYSNRWQAPPRSIEPSSLVLGAENAEQDPGMGHLPFTKRAFLTQGPVFLQEGTVTEEELDGFRMWEEAKGGYFA